MPHGTDTPGAHNQDNMGSPEVPSNECYSRVRSLLSCPIRIAIARGVRGDEAQRLVDLLDEALERACFDDKLRQRCLRLLTKICKTNKIIPSSCALRRELIQIGRVRCHGGSADVRDGKYLGLTVAIKCLTVNEGDSDRIHKRICREIIGWRHLDHPNILPLLGVSVSADSPCFCILSRWMSNGDVMQYARSNPNENRLRLLSQVMSGVAYLHKLSIVHGDLKGANILVDCTGAARVADFGLMTMADMGTVLLSVTPVSSVGTFRWMSPELLDPGRSSSDGRPTQESDCHALGMLIYEVLTGLEPFHQLRGYAPVFAILAGGRPEKPYGAESLGFSDELWMLVQLCWSESISSRPTARDLRDYLYPASFAWVPPETYPVAWGDDGGNAGSDSSGYLGMLLQGSTR